MTLLEAAVALGAAVGPVIPVRGKVPLQKDWPTSATRTPVDSPEWREATGIGLVTGSRSGYFVLDIDGAIGAETLRALCAKYGELPPTLTSHTGGGGAHLVYASPDFPVTNYQGGKKLGPGLDVRGEGGQIVAPPSRHWIAEKHECGECMMRGPAWHSGGCSRAVYAWAPGRAPGDIPIAVAPAWLLDLLRPKPMLVPAPTPAALSDSSEVFRRASAYLAKIPGAVEHSGGHPQAWLAALAVVRGFAMSESDAFALLAAEYNPRCVPPWSEKELRHKVRQASQSATVAWGYLRDAPKPERSASSTPAPSAPPSREEPGCDDDVPIPEPEDEALDVFLARHFPPTEYLVDGLLPAHSLTVLMSGPNVGKTFLALDFVFRIAARGLKVYIKEQEGSGSAFQTRLRRAREFHGKVASESVRVSFRRNDFSLLNRSDVDRLIERCQGFDLIILDSLSALAGDVDENDSKQMRAVAEALARIQESTGAAVLALHHMTKDAWRDGEIPTLRNMRGHGVLPGRADCALALVPGEEMAGAVRFTIYVVKQRDDQRSPPRSTEVTLTGPAAIVEVEEPTRPGCTAAELLASMISHIPDPPSKISVENLRKKAQVRKTRVEEAVELGVGKGLLGRHAAGGIYRTYCGRSQSPGPTGTDGPTAHREVPSDPSYLRYGSGGPTPTENSASVPVRSDATEVETIINELRKEPEDA